MNLREPPLGIAPPPYVARLEHLTLAVCTAAESLPSLAALSSLTSLVLLTHDRLQPSPPALAALLGTLGARLGHLEDLVLHSLVSSTAGIVNARGDAKRKETRRTQQEQEGGSLGSTFSALQSLGAGTWGVP